MNMLFSGFDYDHWLFTAIPLFMVAVILWQTRNGRRIVPSLFWLVAGLQVFSLLMGGFLYALALRASQFGRYLFSMHNNLVLSQGWEQMQTVLAGWIAAVLLMGMLWYLFLKRGRGEMLDSIDVATIMLGAVAVGWPSTFIFLAISFALTVLGMIVLIIFRKKSINDRLIVTPFIIPAAILTLFFGPYLLALTHLDKIRF